MDDDDYEFERILCAAIWFDDGIVHEGFGPVNIKTGLVFAGFRHCSIFPQVGGVPGNRPRLGDCKEIQGFITDCNRFLDREESAKVAYNSGQIDEYKRTLFSEDLY